MTTTSSTLFPPNKIRYIVSFSLLFFFGLLFYIKQALEPQFSLNRDLFSLPIWSKSTVPHHNDDIDNNETKPNNPQRIEDAFDVGLLNGNETKPINTTRIDDDFDVGLLNSNETKPINTTRIDDDFDVGTLKKNETKPIYTTRNVDDFDVGLLKNCDIYTGKWVKDDEDKGHKPASCPYVDDGFDCHGNGRPDYDYLKWYWKPDGCQLPRFNPTDFLERLRGKKLLLVGDSMNRNQFESLICLLWEGLPNKTKMHEVHGYKITKGRGYYIFKFEDYECTIDFLRSHFLVKEGIRIGERGKTNPTLSIDKIDKSANRWKKADILVFNTGHWWNHGKTARGINYYKEGDYIHPTFDALEAYRRAMKTWAKWIDKNISPKQLVFYRGYSSAHFSGGDWDSGGSCQGESEPVLSGSILDLYPPKMKIVEEVLQEMKFPVVLLNITKLTNFRKDGHPSIYGKNVTKGVKVSRKKQDCSHWCIPGVPDAWNQLIYVNLLLKQTPSTILQ